MPKTQVLFCVAVSAVQILCSAIFLRVEASGPKEGFTRGVLLHIMIGGLLGAANLLTWWRYSGRYMSLPKANRPKTQ